MTLVPGPRDHDESGRLPHLVDEVRLLHRVSAEINAARDVPRVVDVTLDTMDELFGFYHASAFLFDNASGQLERAASRGDAFRPVPTRVRLGEGMVGAAAAKRAVVRLNRVPRRLTPTADGAIASHLAVPMLARGELSGVVYLERQASRPLRQRDEALVAIVANQSAVALENARLNQGLEARVRERTSELAASNLQLREAQAEIVQASKLAAVGQLAAGLAHEMNTPLGAIQSGADVVRRAAAVVADAVAAGPGPSERAPRLARSLSALGRAGDSMSSAASRLSTLLATLRRFARLDEAESKWANLNEGLDSTLALMANRLEPGIQVVRRYADLPQVLCQPRELNQVFSTLLGNAIEAIDEPGAITLTTRHDADAVLVEIEDTGRGIAPERLETLFEPGFGTGSDRVKISLGLAIARRIVQQHGGGIRIESEVGRGTRVRLTLPVERREPTA